jgi:hypothetical protein
MPRSNLYHVVYHMKSAASGKRILGPYTEFVQAATPTADAVIAVLSSNGITAPGGHALEIERIATCATPNALS